MRRTALAVLCLSIALGGCKAKELADKAAIAKDLDKKGTVDLMKQAADDSYDPPADNKLTETQVQMYLKVREHEKKIAEVAKERLQKKSEEVKKEGEKSLAGFMTGIQAMGDAADLMTAEIRAAKDLGYNSQEYLWVKQQILEASGSAMAEKINDAMTAQMDATYQQMKKQYDEAKDEQTKKMYGDMLAGYDKSRQEMAQQQSQQEPHIAYNRQLLTKYENALAAWTTEMSKYSDKPMDVQKSVSEFEQQVDKAKADAQKQQ